MNDSPSASDGVVVVVTEDGPALLFDGSGDSDGGMERGTLLVEKTPNATKVVGYQDEPARRADARVDVRAAVPRSRPRERRAAGAKDSRGGSRGGDSGDGSRSTGDKPRPSDDDDEDDHPGVALPALVVRLPLEGRLEARLEGPAGNLRLDDWFRASGVLLELARFALDLDEALAHVDVDDEVDR